MAGRKREGAKAGLRRVQLIRRDELAQSHQRLAFRVPQRIGVARAALSCWGGW